MEDKIKLLAYKFEHNEKLNNEELKLLFQIDQEIFEDTGKHFVKNYKELKKKCESINKKENENMDFEDIRDSIEEKLESGKGFNFSMNKLLLVFIILLLGVIIFQSIRSNAKIKELENREPDVTEIKVSNEVVITETNLLRAISPVAELATYSYSYANIDIYEKAHTFGNSEVKVPFTTDKTLFAYSGTIRAGIKKIDTIKFDIDNENKKIVANMPKPEILSNSITKFESYDVKNSVFTDTSLAEHEDFKKALLENQENLLMKESEYWTELKKNTEKLIESLIKVNNDLTNYTIEFNWEQ